MNYSEIGTILLIGELVVAAIIMIVVIYAWERRAMSFKKVPIQLVVMRLADMWNKHPDQDETHVCSECEEPVGIYPDGQAALKRHPDIKIICQRCASFDYMTGEYNGGK